MLPEFQSVGFAYEDKTVSNTAVGLTPATFLPDGLQARVAQVYCEGGQLRYRYDGGDPTASSGIPLEPGDVVPIVGTQNIRQFRAIRTGATDGTLRVTYER